MSDETSVQTKPNTRKIKQIAFAIGIKREQKLDAIALAYNQAHDSRIGRNDIIRYLIDNLSQEDLSEVNLREYKR